LSAPDKETAALVKLARENPFRFFTLEEVGKICGFGKDTMTALAALRAPIVARKCNPNLLIQWIGENHDRIDKIRE
jgi:hypothetical protein